MAIDKLPKKIGAEMLFTKSFTPTKLIGGLIMFFAMLAATVAAVNTLGIDMITVIFGRLLEFSGGILIGAVILVTGNALSSLAYNKLVENGNQNTANIARIAIMGLVLSMGLKAMGLADNIVNMAFGLTMGGVAVAFALAFGLGGRDAAKVVADAWADKVKKTKITSQPIFPLVRVDCSQGRCLQKPFSLIPIPGVIHSHQDLELRAFF